MTDTITPASLRAHADHMERVHLDGISAEEMRQEAARLEAESARDEEVEKLARALHESRAKREPWDQLRPHQLENYRLAAHAALDFLAADGRLLPEGGTVLTKDPESVDNRQLADVLEVLHDQGNSWREIAEHTRQIFATTPAVSVPDDAPDGTPEKPWPTAADVPENVLLKDCDQLYCVKTQGQMFAVSILRPAMPSRAPFVRVDGDKA